MLPDEIEEGSSNFIEKNLTLFLKNCNINLFIYIIKDEKNIFNQRNFNENFIKAMIDPLISIKDLDDNNQEPELDPPKFELKIDKKFDLNITEYDKSPEEEQIFSKKEKFQFQYKIPEIKLEEEKLISSKIGKILEIENGIIHSERNKREFKVPKNLINTSLLEIIFEPNLPTETILTEVGTQIDIYEFIKLCLNPTPNPKIYRQLGDGFIKNYGLTIIIDSSYSFLGGLSREHSIDTIRVLFSSFLL